MSYVGLAGREHGAADGLVERLDPRIDGASRGRDRARSGAQEQRAGRPVPPHGRRAHGGSGPRRTCGETKSEWCAAGVELVSESRVVDRGAGWSGMLGAVGKQWIVDVHSHVVPTGDDGARTIEDGLQLCRDAAKHGTRVLYATPHIHAKWDHYPLTAERLRRYDEAFPVMRAACQRFGLDLRRGFEVYPGALPGSADLHDYGLTGSGAYLIEFPGFWTPERDALALVRREAERAEEAGLLPVLAHPERCAQIVGATAAGCGVRRSRLAARAERAEPRRPARPEVAGDSVAAARVGLRRSGRERRTRLEPERAARLGVRARGRRVWASSVRAACSTAARSSVPAPSPSPPD